MTDIVVHTSDLILYRRCRRKWNWGSYMRQNYRSISSKPPLWFGSGAHYALEDKHGYQKHPSAASAFLAYGEAHREDERPEEYEEMLESAKQIMEYYDLWLKERKNFTFQTYWEDGVPQVEVKFQVPIFVPGIGWVTYEGVFDGVAIDEHKRLWIKEYKTARQFNTSKLDLDFQVTAYTWAAAQIYKQPFEGVLYMQFHKTPPQKPKVLKNGQISVNKNQRTTYRLFWSFLKEYYGGKEKVPSYYLDYLRHLYSQENDWGDPFIRYDLVRRNLQQLASFEGNVTEQLKEMVDPSLSLYPNPTQDCSWDCDFRDACLAKDSEYDYESILKDNFRTRSQRERMEDWRDRLFFEPVKEEA